MTVRYPRLARQGPARFLSLFLLGCIVATKPPAVLADNQSSNYFDPLKIWTRRRHTGDWRTEFHTMLSSGRQGWTQGDPAITIQSSHSPYNIFTSPTALNGSGEQFPCGATYDTAYPDGAPQVLISIDWCNSHCGGWQESATSTTKFSQWLQPFMGFICPRPPFS